MLCELSGPRPSCCPWPSRRARIARLLSPGAGKMGVDANWMQSGCKVYAKWMQEATHAADRLSGLVDSATPLWSVSE